MEKEVNSEEWRSVLASYSAKLKNELANELALMNDVKNNNYGYLWITQRRRVLRNEDLFELCLENALLNNRGYDVIRHSIRHWENKAKFQIWLTLCVQNAVKNNKGFEVIQYCEKLNNTSYQFCLYNALNSYNNKGFELIVYFRKRLRSTKDRWMCINNAVINGKGKDLMELHSALLAKHDIEYLQKRIKEVEYMQANKNKTI